MNIKLLRSFYSHINLTYPTENRRVKGEVFFNGVYNIIHLTAWELITDLPSEIEYIPATEDLNLRW